VVNDVALAGSGRFSRRPIPVQEHLLSVGIGEDIHGQLHGLLVSTDVGRQMLTLRRTLEGR
jgi:hypothetical protein